MFSKTKPTDGNDKHEAPTLTTPSAPSSNSSSSSSASSSSAPAPSAAPKPKPAPSILSSDLMVKGNLITTGDIQVEGTVEGDIRAHLLTIGEGATVKGEVIADDVVINGRILGRVRGLKVRLTASARVEGDIIHKTIAIESGAHFEGSVQRADDPLSTSEKSKAPVKATA
ncbi:polymer-forming cytoskeletal protein [Abyssibius alkaniclasticus]|uniref:bactofilin family protein n=1 Tax=Abyssibius alkaniclasticus TaxID=2881234 RepID=UPI002363F089|nr:polymer-forming cytoskeletal protein [Abyssibius alkaniclasticus]UPH70658.1 polymer-forming cytoskeletal protein [Abyssibius alkaniclasticus]